MFFYLLCAEQRMAQYNAMEIETVQVGPPLYTHTDFTKCPAATLAVV